MKKLHVAILGATGMVGRELLDILVERDFPIAKLTLMSSARSAGNRVLVGGKEYAVQEASPEAFQGVDVAFFAAGGQVSRQWADIAVEAGALVIDNTSAFRLRDDVPLVVPEVNGEEVRNHRGIIANPNCSTIIMVLALKPIFDRAGIKRVVVSTYQAVSGAGGKAMDELRMQTEDYLAGREMAANILPVAGAPRHYPIAFNLIPQIDEFAEDDYTKEEWKMVRETQKLFKAPELKISPTTIRIPVMRCHSESINVETEAPLSPEECRELLRGAPGVQVVDDPAAQEYPMPLWATGKDAVYVGRIRRDPTVENGLNLWVVGDQVRKGAALNAVQIAELAHKLGAI
ncbi:MAG: aspartate-semialdehyde dehydrogenase [Limnochordia bacterium]|jgi:aspartate-semialdehyde dehydrogenase|nr:aspartate-semialdehyde dehydrogenase [Limnochordia bacterium]MDI9464934.1 aspartate-semialdehyde dehydrogenase [Bacillota bacterium]NLO96000.1 aspartate-semialdehyde dehydrogenase [Bacillota bacterium]HAI52014.1 aspartate-semialdehyde dehydrogenase [Bacillota bacterium]HOB41441.1 aspartate-semialdehyde dehydrogenase [Limnochordia bacterium]